MTSQKRSKFKATDYWFKAEREETELITKGLKESFKVMESLCIFTVILCDCQNSEMYTTWAYICPYVNYINKNDKGIKKNKCNT